MILVGLSRNCPSSSETPRPPPVRGLAAVLPSRMETLVTGGPSLVFYLGLWSLPSSLTHGLDGVGVGSDCSSFLARPEWGGGAAGLQTSSPAWVLDRAALALERGSPSCLRAPSGYVCLPSS